LLFNSVVLARTLAAVNTPRQSRRTPSAQPGSRTVEVTGISDAMIRAVEEIGWPARVEGEADA